MNWQTTCCTATHSQAPRSDRRPLDFERSRLCNPSSKQCILRMKHPCPVRTTQHISTLLSPGGPGTFDRRSKLCRTKPQKRCTSPATETESCPTGPTGPTGPTAPFKLPWRSWRTNRCRTKWQNVICGAPCLVEPMSLERSLSIHAKLYFTVFLQHLDQPHICRGFHLPSG